VLPQQAGEEREEDQQQQGQQEESLDEPDRCRLERSTGGPEEIRAQLGEELGVNQAEQGKDQQACLQEHNQGPVEQQVSGHHHHKDQESQQVEQRKFLPLLGQGLSSDQPQPSSQPAANRRNGKDGVWGSRAGRGRLASLCRLRASVRGGCVTGEHPGNGIAWMAHCSGIRQNSGPP
jgi:hypothetical protein